MHARLKTTSFLSRFPREPLIAAVSVIGLAVLFGSVWAARMYPTFGTPAFSPLNRVCSILVLLIVAVLSSKRQFTARAAFYLAILSYIAHALAVIATAMTGDSLGLASLGVVSSMFEGISFGICELVLLVALVKLPRRLAACSIAGAYMLASLYETVFP